MQMGVGMGSANRMGALPESRINTESPARGKIGSVLYRLNSLPHGIQTAVLTVVALLVLIIRRPAELLTGYFYAEEGATYFQYAWNATSLQALFAPHQGYYSLYPNVVMLIAAHLLPVQTAAAFGAWCGLAIVLLMVYFVVKSDLFTTFNERALAAGVCLFTSPGLATTLSSINSQYFLAVCTAIILFSAAKRISPIVLLTLLLAGLTGVISCLLAPFFVVKAYLERSRARALQAAALLLCAALEAAVIWRLRILSPGSFSQHHSLSSILDALLLGSPVMEFGSRASWHFASVSLATHTSGLIWSGAAIACVVVFGLLLYLVRGGGKPAMGMALAGIFIGLVSLFAAIGQGSSFIRGSVRYLLVSNVLIGLAVLIAFLRRREARAITFTLPAVLLVTLFLSGALDLVTYRRLVRCEPPWPSQVHRWILDETIPLEVAPHDWGHAFTIAHRHPERNDLPSSIYDSIKGRSVVAPETAPTPCKEAD